jgi:hypothetical protein
MDVRGVVGGQVIPNKNAMVVRPVHAEPFDLCANVITEIAKNVSGCTYPLNASNPLSRLLDTSPSLWRQGRIPRLDGEEDGDLATVMVVTVLPHPEYLEGPPTRPIALFEGDPKLVDVDELPSRHLEYSERRRAIPKIPYAELNVLALRLVGLRQGSFLHDPELLQPLGDCLPQ